MSDTLLQPSPAPAAPAPVLAPPPKRSGTIQHWNVEDEQFWKTVGAPIARRNLIISIPALLLAFAVWQLFSVAAPLLPLAGFAFTGSQLLGLAALPSLSGATLRIFYSFMVPVFGGRNWTVISTLSLLIPCIGFGIAVQNPATPYWVFVILALACGFGSGNFASSMANISFFFPKSAKGTALGLNAGLGNLGVSVVQFGVPLVVALGIFGAVSGGVSIIRPDGSAATLHLANAGFVWVPLIVLAALAAWFGMNNLATARASVRDQAVIFRRKHNWLMCWLYIGTFGSFIGFAAGFPLLLKAQFPGVSFGYAFVGPLLGALIRPLGGWLSDKVGGAAVTLWTFGVMILAAGGVIWALRIESFPLFVGLFFVLFMCAGVGNGSTFRMIPVIFQNLAQKRLGNGEANRTLALQAGARESAAVLGFSSAVGAYGGFFIPKSYGWSFAATGGAEAAFWGFIAFYITCVVMTWWYYARRNAEAPC